MQSLIEIADGDAPDLALANLGVEARIREVKVCDTFKREVSFSNVAFVLRGVEAYDHYLLYMQFA